MSKWISLVLVGLMLTVGATLGGCKQEGPAEKAGKALDSAAKDAGKDIEDKAEEGQKAIEGATEKAAE